MIIVVRFRKRNDFVPVLYRFCSSLKTKIVSELQRNYYKTTKIGYIHSAFSPQSASKINSTSRELLNPSFAIGKRKEESGRLALSLQYVFSESQNASGSS